MNIRDIIQKARETAKNPDEMLLSERFEEFIDLIEMNRKCKNPQERKEIEKRLARAKSSLKEVAEKVSASYGMDPKIFDDLKIAAPEESRPKSRKNKGMRI